MRSPLKQCSQRKLNFADSEEVEVDFEKFAKDCVGFLWPSPLPGSLAINLSSPP